MNASQHIKIVRGNYFFVRRVNGELIRKVLGKVCEISAEEAGQRAERLVGETVAEKPAPRHAMTLRDVWERYLTVYAKPHKKSWKQEEALYEYHLAKQYGDCEVHKFDLAAAHSAIGTARGKVVANRVANMVRKMYRVVGLDAPKVKKFKERSRERFLTREEIERLLAAIEASTPTVRDFVVVCLYTGARSGNVRSMCWSEVDLDAGVWTVPAEKSKNGRSLRVHLSEKVVTVLASREHIEGTDYVFPMRPGGGGRYVDTPMVQPRKYWLKVCASAGLTDVTIHDLRRTLGSHLAMSGVSMAVVAKVLGHADMKSTAIYARLSPSAASAAVDAVVAGF